MENIEKLTELWESTFDHIYCLHYLGYRDRKEKADKEFQRVGISQAKNFSYYYTFDSPFYGWLHQSGVPIRKDCMQSKISAFKCGLGHYCIMKEANGLGYNRILIIEDDVCFLKDVDLLYSILKDTPEDYDIILYDSWPFYRGLDSGLMENRPVNRNFSEFDDKFNSGACYCTNKEARDMIISKQESLLMVADNVYHNTTNDGLKRCFTNTNISRQNPSDLEKKREMNILYSLKHQDDSLYEK